MRQYRPTDHGEYCRLLAAAGMPEPRLDYWEQHLLPDGFFVIEHDASHALVATCMASHHPKLPRHPRAGNLGWVASDPAHAGKGLGKAVVAAVTRRLIAAGYQRIYLETDDFRHPAIKLYLAMGWQPLVFSPEMESRWRQVCVAVGQTYTPSVSAPPTS